MTWILFALIAGAWILRGRQRWAWAGLALATLMWIFGTFGGELWNVSREARGSGIPPNVVADTSLNSPAANAFLWASAGALLGVVAMAAWSHWGRKPATSLADMPTVRTSSIKPLADLMRPTWLMSVSAVLFVAWMLGQGPSLWSRDSYLAANGMGALLTATSTPAPLIGATVLAASLIVPASRRTRGLAMALGAAWWICTLAVGTRLAVLFPLAVMGVLAAWLVRTRPSGKRLYGVLALLYVTAYLAIYSFGITLEVREVPHGILRLPELFAYDGRPNLFFLSWGPILLKMVSSVASSYVITDHSVLHPPPAWVLWMNANPLPESIAGIDAFSHERMWPLEWVPLSMVGEWYGVYGPLGQVLLFGSTVLVSALTVEFFASRKQRFFAALALVLTIATVTISIQYPSRWFWRLLSLTIVLPLVYAAGNWLLGRIRSSGAYINYRNRKIAEAKAGRSRLRVTILGGHYAPEPTGNAPYTAGLARGLAERGHDVRVITTHPHYPEWRIKDGYGGWSVHDEVNGVRVRRLAHYVPANPTGMRRLLSELSLGLRYLIACWHRPDVVLLVSPNLFSTAVAAFRARWSPRVATGIWVQDIYSLGVLETGQGGKSVASLVRAVESSTLRSATGVAVIHDRFRNFATSNLGVAPSQVNVIRNWSHVQPAPQVDRASVRHRLGWHPSETVVLHAGNMGMKQGLENVAEAARLADTVDAPIRFVLLGDGNQRERLQSLAVGVRSIQFIAPLPDGEFEQVLASADVLLINEREGMREMSVPSKLTTYFSTSLPVLAATDRASVTAGEIDASGGGVRVDAGDPRALLDAALALGTDAALAGALGAAGSRYRHQVLGEQAALDSFEYWLATLASHRDARKHRASSTLTFLRR